jgi:hypothetical protein
VDLGRGGDDGARVVRTSRQRSGSDRHADISGAVVSMGQGARVPRQTSLARSAGGASRRSGVSGGAKATLAELVAIIPRTAPALVSALVSCLISA